MPLLLTGLIRAAVRLQMPKAFKAGMTRTAFYNKLRLAGPVYRKSTFMSDWRTMFNIESQKDAYKYVRKDRVPSPKVFAELPWKRGKEFLYRANTWSRTHPDEPFKEQIVSLQSDKPLSAREVEEQIETVWSEQEKYEPYKLERVEATEFYRKVPIEAE